MVSPKQQIRFCTNADGVRIAYATTGNGPALVRAAHWLTHIEFDGSSPVWRHWVTELSRNHTLVRYDGAGCGLSDWNITDLSFESWVHDLEAVVDAARIPRFVLLGISRGGAIAVAYAARHPERVSHLVLYGAFGRGYAVRGNPSAEVEEHDMAIELAERGWDRDNPAARQMFATLFQPDGSPAQHRSFTEMMRLASSPKNGGRLQREAGVLNVEPLAGKVICPTLVLHARSDARVPFEEGRRLASLIPDARFVPLEGRNHILVEDEPAWGQLVAELRAFLPDALPTPFAALSARENEILERVAQGLDNQQIAADLYLSEKTVRNHITSIFSKLEVQTRAQAIVRAHEAGFARPKATR